MNKLPNVTRGTAATITNTQNELFKIPDDALPPALFYFRNTGLIGSIFLKQGVDGSNDRVSSSDFHYVFLPGEEKLLDNPGSGSILIISDQAAGVPFSWSVRYTTVGVAPGANVA